MAKFEINSEQDLKDGKLDGAELGDVIIHRRFHSWQLEALLVQYYPHLIAEVATLGTSLYTKYGMKASMVTAKL